MSQAIRIALIVVAVVSIIAMVAPLVVNVTEMLLNAFPMLNTTVASLAPYMSWARRLFNALCGGPRLAQLVIVFVVSMPISYYFTSIVSRVYRLIIGN